LLTNVSGGVSALAFSGLGVNQRWLNNDNTTELYVGSPFDGKVQALRLDQKGKPQLRDVTNGVLLAEGVRSLAFTRNNQQLYAATCNKTTGQGQLFAYENSHIRQQFEPLSTIDCLGEMQWGNDNVLYTVDATNRSIVAVYSGVAVVLAQLPVDVIPVGLQFNSKWHAYVGANRVTRNRRQAEIYAFDLGKRTLQLSAAVGGAVLDSFAFSYDDRLFFTDRAHAAIHEVELGDLVALNAEGALIAAGLQSEPVTFRTKMLYGSAGLTAGGGVAAFSTTDGACGV
jgi:hypothetical protein